jgi:hypothetical protein
MQLFCFGLCGNVGLVGNIWVIYAMTEWKIFSFPLGLGVGRDEYIQV